MRGPVFYPIEKTVCQLLPLSAEQPKERSDDAAIARNS